MAPLPLVEHSLQASITAPSALPRLRGRPGAATHGTGAWGPRPGRASPQVVRTQAPDKSAMVQNLNQLLALTMSSVDPDHERLHGPPVDGPSWLSNGAQPGSGNQSPAINGIPDQQTTSTSSSSQQAQEQEPIYRPVLNPQSSLPPLRAASLDADDYHPSDGWRPRPHHLHPKELWERIREEARLDSVLEPALATFLHSVILSHNSMEGAMAFLLANKLSDGMMLGSVQLMSLIREVYEADPDILAAGLADMHAVLDRDPACGKFSQCMLQFKGYQAIQAYRVTHHLWNQGRQSLALAIQARVSELFAVDIHPAATIGRGVMLDHATGIVIGETAVVGDNVSMLHHVSLGGSGIGRNVRHPRIQHGVLIGAGVAVLGPVVIGAGSKIGAGSVVVNDLPEHCVAVGVPARIVKKNLRSEPVKEMDQCADFILDYVI